MDTAHDGPTLFDALADPAFAYRVEDGTPRVTETNPAFADVFGAADAGQSVGTALPGDEAVRVLDADDARESVFVHEGRTYLARDVAAGGDAGYVVCVDVTDAAGDVAAAGDAGDRVTEFANVIAHDVRNPLEAAKIRLEVARETGDLEHLAEIETALERIEDIVANGVDLARSGYDVGDPVRVDVADVADDAWRMTDTADATLELDDDLPVVDGDPSRLQGLFENLFRNAVEHAGRDVTVRVGRLDGDESGGFFVADDGPGVPADIRGRVFETGFTTGGGSGLGLAIVARVADAHGWDVTVTESDTGGARFEVRGVEDA